ncbi:MAG: hypothetical protein KKI02_07710 [Planctomycetes bacterium]|nr:hypothetical protein [Planctomycetota bacterium]
MRNRRPNWRLLNLTIVVLALPIAALGEEVTVQTDSFVTGGSAVIVGNFVPGEHAGVRLTSPCDGAIVAVQIGWLSESGDTGQGFERAIHIYEGSTFPTPGTELLVLEGPVLTDGALNQFRYLDDQGTVPINIPISMGEQFYVTLEFENPTDILNGTPSVFRDLDGCHAQGNVLYAIPGGWTDFCIILVGDLVIRAVIDCEEMQGACCLSDGTCVVVTPSGCATQDGTYQGDGVSCSSVECPQPVQACCFELTGGCLDLTADDCLTAGGIPAGVGTECGTYVCFPIGACCLPDATCQDGLSPEGCAALEGVFQGDGTDCATTECPDPSGACCFSTGGCLALTEANCAVAGGTWTGPGTDCSDDNGNGTPDACESGCPNAGSSGSYCDADIDGSGDCLVNLADLAQLLSNYGMSSGATHDDGDIDPPGGDGDVDLGDLATLLSQYGDNCN